MKKTLIALVAVAVLGLMSHFVGEHRTPQLATQPTSAASVAPAATQDTSTTASQYKNGTYTGAAQSNPYGTVQVAAVISSGKISDVQFLQMPSDMQHSAELSSLSEPLLKQTTLQNQSANIDFVSGATLTSNSYQASLQSALDQAAASSSSTTTTQ